MANSHTWPGTSLRWLLKQATTIGRLNVARIGMDHLHEALNKIMDTAAADGLNFSVAAPLKVEVSAGTIWTLGWWQSGDGRWWLLGNTADVASFTRADAEFYIPTGDISDVPAS